MDLQEQAAGTIGREPVDADRELAGLRAVCRRQGEVIDGLGRRCATLRRGALALQSENERLRAELDRRLGTGVHRGRPGAARRGPPAGEIALPAGPRAPGAARIVLSHWLRGQAPPGVIDDAQLVVSELITNSLRHAGVGSDDVLRLAVEIHKGVVRVEVQDPGSHGVIAPRRPDLASGGGFGLNVVLALAARWGVVRDRSTRVWVELNWPTDAVANPA
jgi:anti-sigma regulatory factor (Ser/Thr protein kinase)